MSAEFLLRFLGGGAAFGLLGALLFAAGAAISGRRDALRAAPLVFLALLFLALTQHPFPDPEALRCPVASAEPQLRPFAFLTGFAERWESGGAAALLRDRHASATAMNVALPFAVGLALAPVAPGRGFALAFGAGLTLLAETTQLTGFWGLYPCAWRQFNVDDLMLNLAGLLLGHAAGRRLIPRSRRGRRGG